jgi:hypothetical protein
MEPNTLLAYTRPLDSLPSLEKGRSRYVMLRGVRPCTRTTGQLPAGAPVARVSNKQIVTRPNAYLTVSGFVDRFAGLRIHATFLDACI